MSPRLTLVFFSVGTARFSRDSRPGWTSRFSSKSKCIMKNQWHNSERDKMENVMLFFQGLTGAPGANGDTGPQGHRVRKRHSDLYLGSGSFPEFHLTFRTVHGPCLSFRASWENLVLPVCRVRSEKVWVDICFLTVLFFTLKVELPFFVHITTDRALNSVFLFQGDAGSRGIAGKPGNPGMKVNIIKRSAIWLQGKNLAHSNVC